MFQKKTVIQRSEEAKDAFAKLSTTLAECNIEAEDEIAFIEGQMKAMQAKKDKLSAMKTSNEHTIAKVDAILTPEKDV